MRGLHRLKQKILQREHQRGSVKNVAMRRAFNRLLLRGGGCAGYSGNEKKCKDEGCNYTENNACRPVQEEERQRQEKEERERKEKEEKLRLEKEKKLRLEREDRLERLKQKAAELATLAKKARSDATEATKVATDAARVVEDMCKKIKVSRLKCGNQKGCAWLVGRYKNKKKATKTLNECHSTDEWEKI